MIEENENLNETGKERNYNTTQSADKFNNFQFDSKKQRYPYCIVWTPLPVI